MKLHEDERDRLYQQIKSGLQILKWSKRILLQLGNHVPDFNSRAVSNPQYFLMLIIKEVIKVLEGEVGGWNM